MLYTQRHYLKIYVTRLIGYIIVYINKFKIIDNKFKMLYVRYNNKQYDTKIDYHLINDKPLSNIQLAYNYNSKYYLIVYKNYEQYYKIKFPIYTSSELINKNSFSKNADSIILASTNRGATKEFIDNQNITIIRNLSGPKGNFYKDIMDVDKMTIINTFNYLSDIQTIDNLELFYSDGEIYNI